VGPVPDDDMGEEIKADVVRRDASAVEAIELASYLSGRLARFKVPRYWEFRDGLPHTPSERIAQARAGAGPSRLQGQHRRPEGVALREASDRSALVS
jgi:carnitine-CoA ligase